MNLKFKTHKLIDSDQQGTIEKTVLFLQKSNYNIVGTTATSILFNDDGNNKAYSDRFMGNRINKGMFEFAGKNGLLEISLTYRFSIFPSLIQLSIIGAIAFIRTGFTVLPFFIIIVLVNVLIFLFKVQLVRNNFIGDIFREQE
ncbi:hypothetical protein [Mucilaginibacter gotjawali]|uniref:Uncharacterized protein n=2 Tax=Mucilaginibacter gotjawali TaxID=1550579 RepID=A0A839SIH2_9SPHI|nr:hypothetical protein [Mucilaginibacter gotjawali]MBB3057192.1 hypothetical protein [Mucilaginibacter gotjawali]BAU53041.1 hypothetical protein MgSA37_01208 [Mucilaginibacter gotjawali]